MTGECFEVFKLRGLLSRLSGDDAKTVRMAINKIEELQRELMIDEEMLCGMTIRAATAETGDAR